MGHDISGYNKAGKEICYIRFGMWNLDAGLFYDLFDANDYNAGVSGSGDSIELTLPQIEKALKGNNQLKDGDFHSTNQEFLIWQRKEIHNFINSCLETAQKERSVKVYFG